jgi:hypothetical protein
VQVDKLLKTGHNRRNLQVIQVPTYAGQHTQLVSTHQQAKERVMKKVFLLFVVTTAGCASYIETVKVNPETLQATGTGVAGVMYYEPKLVKVRYEFTQLVDKEKGLIGSSLEGTCKPVVQKEEIVTLPDYQNPRAVLHKPTWFASSEFGVTLNNGMLASVTTKSTPQTAPILEQIVKAKEASVFAVTPTAACNSGPVITKNDPVKF